MNFATKSMVAFVTGLYGGMMLMIIGMVYFFAGIEAMDIPNCIIIGIIGVALLIITVKLSMEVKNEVKELADTLNVR